MKTKLILICCTLLFISCLPDEEEVRIGFMFTIINKTNIEYENVKITIGGIQNGSFIGTESYTLPTIRIRNNDTEAQYAAVDNKRWEPNLTLIKAISEEAYFTVQTEGGTEILLYDKFQNDRLVNAKITENGIIKSNYGGDLSISIYEDTIRGLFFEQE